MIFFGVSNKKILILALFFILLAPSAVRAVNSGDSVNFYIDSNYDSSARSQTTATLVKTTSNIYFYVEKKWLDSQMPAKQNEILLNLDYLSSEFSNRIYPTLKTNNLNLKEFRSVLPAF